MKPMYELTIKLKSRDTNMGMAIVLMKLKLTQLYCAVLLKLGLSDNCFEDGLDKYLPFKKRKVVGKKEVDLYLEYDEICTTNEIIKSIFIM